MNLASAKLDLDVFRQMTLRTLTMKKKLNKRINFGRYVLRNAAKLLFMSH